MRFEYRPYRRSFRQPLQTSHGLWTVREGIILRLTNDAGCVGFGEIAPLSWFGSEHFEDAIAFCQQLPEMIGFETIAAIPAHLSACQFGFESAWEMLTTDLASKSELTYSAAIRLAITVPARLIIKSGLRPKRSESLPIIGVAKNCAIA